MLSQSSPDEVFDVLVFIWSECGKDDHMIQMAVRALRPATLLLVERAAELHKFAKAHPSEYARLIRLHMNICPLYSPPPVIASSRSLLSTEMAKRYKPRWISGSSPAPASERSPSSYCFCIDGVDGYFESHDWILFPQWIFFRNLIQSGMKRDQDSSPCRHTFHSRWCQSSCLPVTRYMHHAS